MREMTAERHYWKRFYKAFCDYLYDDIGCFDNYAGSQIKIIKAFFNFLNKELTMGIGEFHRSFYVRRENIAIFPLMPEELNFLISNKHFEEQLSFRMKQVKDFFVFGCTVALRVSDLFALRTSNIRIVNGMYYLTVRSQKTSVHTHIKLPEYAVNIINRNTQNSRLLPHFSSCNLNRSIKKLLELAGFNYPVQLLREKRGKVIELCSSGQSGIRARFCDVCASHTMRRTAITTMLSLGMQEQLVRRISGHAPGSKEFYRYVLWAQSYQDKETDKMFEKLRDGMG
ncbi:MAG TPA: tyrosine-type recombinase/integrase [Chitinophagaceae bacterium]|nr:tyrosine-type recombinase/integrase [Chitinophagaceae bacterium]HQV84513.1 tyrosine-type recombinase/integrase [Chitinophagaceae bacterium]HQX73720.1 tyrosine-type recombinase/integrase [Chitinophagaceae bacterium]HQZ74945.1 tyrosine-type recombinase/integrase [Chitinophagaceae bacterium]